MKVAVRSDQISASGNYYGSVVWLTRYGFSADQLFLKVYSVNNGGGTCYADLYFKATGTYDALNVRVLNSGGRGGKGTP